MGFPIIPGPNYANNLQSGLGFSNGSGPSIQTGTVDPTVTATDGIKGSIYLNSSTGKQYAKKDNGVSTQWSIITGATSAITFSNSSGVVVFGGGGPTADANLTLTITTTGNPVALSLVSDGSGNTSYIGLAAGGAGQFVIYRNGVALSPQGINNPSSTGTLTMPPGAVNYIDTPAAGTYTYQIYTLNAANNLLYGYVKLAAYELGAGGSTTSGSTTGFKARNNAGFSLNSGGNAYMQFPTVDYDDTSSWLTDTWTCPSTGTWMVSANIYGGFPATTSVFLGASLYINGTASDQLNVNSFTTTGISGNASAMTSVPIRINAGDTVKLRIDQTNGSAVDVNFYGSLSITKIIAISGSGSGITRLVNNISTPTTAGATANTDYVYNVSGTTTLTLPTAVANTNRYSVKNVGSNTVTVAFTGGETADGSSTVTLPRANMSLDFISNGTNWTIE